MKVNEKERESRGGLTARQAASNRGKSVRTAQRWTSMSRERWLAKVAAEREAIRAFHDDAGHSWPETAEHFGLHLNTVKQRAYKARKEREAERVEAERKEREATAPPLFNAS